MTQADYEKKYNEALDIAKSYYEEGTNEFLDTIFPELAESEDERIRTRFIEYFQGFLEGNEDCYKDGGYVRWEGLDVKSILAWLEKQKRVDVTDFCQPIPEDIAKVIPDVVTACIYGEQKQKEQKPAEYGDDVVEEAEEYTTKVDCGEYGVAVTEAYIAGVLSERNRKSAEWSEEDERYLDYIFKYLTNYDFNQDEMGTLEEYHQLHNGAVHFLKSLKPQPKQKWSEEDEENLENIRIYLLHHGEDAWADTITKLKSLRPQPQLEWSEEDKTRRNCCMIYLTNIRDGIEFSQIIGNNVKENSKKEIQKDIDWLKSLPERFNLEPKQEWSEEDEAMYNSIICEVVREGMKPTKEQENWLKSLRPQPKWTKEDEHQVEVAIAFLKDYADKGYENVVCCIDWLKSKLNEKTINA